MKILYCHDRPNPNLLYFSGISLPGFSVPERRTVYSWEMYRTEIERVGWTFRHVRELKRLKGRYETDFDMPYQAFRHIRHLKLVDMSKEWLERRMIKGRREIREMGKAVRIAEKVMEKAMEIARPGMTELELVGEIERLIRKEGCEPAFPVIVSQSDEPHHRPGRRKITAKPLIIDLGVRISSGYVSDISGTLWMDGRMERKFERAFSVIEGWKGGIAELDREIRKIMDFPHALGHGIGLSVHEWPVISGKWKGEFVDGMVFTLEPAVYGRKSARVEYVFFYEDGIWRI